MPCAPSGAGMGHPGVVVAVWMAIASDFPTDDRPITTQPSGDLSLTKTLIETPHNLDPLVLTDRMTTATGPSQITRTRQAPIALTHQKFHRTSVAPPQPRRRRRHTHLPRRRDQRRPLTHPVKQLPPRRPRMRITTRHDNLPKSRMLHRPYESTSRISQWFHARRVHAADRRRQLPPSLSSAVTRRSVQPIAATVSAFLMSWLKRLRSTRWWSPS